MFPVTIIMLLGGALFVSTVANVVLGWMALKQPATATEITDNAEPSA
ncbi:MAG: hypothetical protein M1335_06325 [Chloroflexi bacterium]|nr:hypothetical protein [Chloroflexota bacterium]